MLDSGKVLLGSKGEGIQERCQNDTIAGEGKYLSSLTYHSLVIPQHCGSETLLSCQIGRSCLYAVMFLGRTDG